MMRTVFTAIIIRLQHSIVMDYTMRNVNCHCQTTFCDDETIVLTQDQVFRWNRLLNFLITCSTDAQNNRLIQFPSYDNGHGWDIRLAVPGQPGNDYPTLSSIPRTRFTCAGKDPGYYADVETNCQVFRVCTVGATYGFQSFLCPNGTLFNQAVFVCDWWMNVICNKSDELGKNRNDQFENLKLGPQLMKDVKKMLTHPVRNPVNTHSMKSKVIVMQNYKPPSGQLFPNGALLTPPEKPPSHIYFPTKAIQTVLRQNDYRNANLAYSASTPSPQYIPPTYSTIKPTTVRNVEILQRLRLNDQKNHDEYSTIPVIQNEKIISNGHTGQIPPQSRYSNAINSLRSDQEIRQKYIDLRNSHKTQNSDHIFRVNTQRAQQDLQNARFLGNINEQTLHNSNRDNPANINTSNQSEQELPPLISTKIPTGNTPPRKGNEGLSSRVSSDIVPPTILAKTVAYSRLVQEAKQGTPKSRITFKTWVLKPTRNPKSLENSSPYIYNQPNNIERQIDGSEFAAPYIYNKPKESFTIEDDLQSDLEGYSYPNPTTPSYESNPDNQKISGFYFAPTTLNSLNELLITTTTPQPEETPNVFLAPITFNSSARQYLPPAEISPTVSNQYLPPNSALRKLSQHENLQLITESTPSRIEFNTINHDINFNHPRNQQNSFEDNYNNLSFSDIVSNEKLDITINEIVNDTNDVLKTASPENFHQFIKDFREQSSSDNLSENKSTKKELVLLSGAGFKPAKLISIPSAELEPPIDSFNKLQIENKISNLPFIEDTKLPTIERTVTLKINIPERIANFLFKTHYDAKLEVLNTDSSNYLVLKHMQKKNPDDSFIPIGKLSLDGNSNLSASQALVLSLVVDSINTAKKYNNIIQDNVITPTPSALKQFPAVSSEEFGRISKTVSKLTASQYTSNNLKSKNINTKMYQPRNTDTLNRNKNKETFNSILHGNNTYSDHSRAKIARLTLQASEDSLYSKQNQKTLNIFNSVPQTNTNKIYSGQFYKYSVPEVTRQIINSPSPANSNIIIKSDFDNVKTQDSVILQNTATKSSGVNSNGKVSKTQSLPSKQFARLQAVSTTERSLFNTEDSNILVDNILNIGSGITAQLQDKIVGTVLYPSDRNKFVTYKKDQSYYLQSELLNNGNSIQSKPVQQQNKKETERNSYPDIITFHFISSDDQKQTVNDASQEELSRYRLRESNNFEESTYPTDISGNTRNSVDPQLTKQRQTITRLYDGPSSYLAPQSSIGNLLVMEQNENFKDKIEDLDENDNFNGYLKERPSRAFNF